jgi:mycothiol S-conjugate amidase
MTVHAHPDDESSKGAGTVALYHDAGVHTVLVCCTGGEEGDVLNPRLDTPEVRSNLARIRKQELNKAATLIGYDEIRFLGYRDSGMPGSPANSHPHSFAAAPIAEAVERLVAEIRRSKPQVIVAYPQEQGGYRHPDHLKAHEVTVAAFEAAADGNVYPGAGPPFAPLKLYYVVWSKERARSIIANFRSRGMNPPFDDRWVDKLPELSDNVVRVDISKYLSRVSAALHAHATQIDPDSPFWAGFDPQFAYPFEEYILARSRLPHDVDNARYGLFGGVEEFLSTAATPRHDDVGG